MSYDCLVKLVTPFDEAFEIDYKEVTRLINDSIEKKVEGLFLFTDIGEKDSLQADEKHTLLRHIINVNKQKMKLIVNVSKNSTNKAIKFIEETKHHIIDYYLLEIPFLLNINDELIYVHLASIINEFKDNNFIISMDNNDSFGFEMLIKLLKECSNIKGVFINDDLQLIEKIRNEFKYLKIYVSEEKFVLNSLKKGASGVVSSIGHLFYCYVRELLNDYQNNIENYFLDGYISGLFKILSVEKMPIPLKYLLAKQGYLSMNLRFPLSVLAKNKRQEIDIILE